MQELLSVFKGINSYLESGNQTELIKAFHYYDDQILQLDEDFFRETLDLQSEGESTDALKIMLKLLQVSDEQFGRYTHVTVYQLFTELMAQSNLNNAKKLRHILAILDDKVKLRWEKASAIGLILLLGILTITGLGGASYVQQVLTASAFVPVVGVLTSLISAIYQLSPYKIEKEASFVDRMRDSFFVLSSTALKITISSLAIVAAVVGTPIISILTVVATGVGVIYEAFKLLQMKIQGRKRALHEGDGTLSTKQQDVRFENEYQKKVRSLWIDLAAAVVMVGIVAAWCFIPGGAIVAVGALAAMGLTYFFQWKAQQHNDEIMKKRLQTQFEKVEAEGAEKSNSLQSLQTTNAKLVDSLVKTPTPEPSIGANKAVDDDISEQDLSGISFEKEVETCNAIDSILLSKASLTEVVSSDDDIARAQTL